MVPIILAALPYLSAAFFFFREVGADKIIRKKMQKGKDLCIKALYTKIHKHTVNTTFQ